MRQRIRTPLSGNEVISSPSAAMKILRTLSIAFILVGFLLNSLNIHQQMSHRAESKTAFGVSVNTETGTASIQDFAFFWHVSHYWSRGQLERPYHSGSLVTFFHEWTGLDNPELAMRFFYHPALLVALIPLTWLQPEWGYGVFAFFSLLVVSSAIGWIFRSRNVPGIFAMGLLFYGSLGLTATLSIGQLSPLFAACLAPLVLMRRDRFYDRDNKPTAALLLCSIKPTLAFPIVTSLLPARKLRSVMYFFMISFLILVILTPFLGWQWPVDYISSAVSHTGTEAESAFRAGTGSETHANLSNLLNRLSPLAHGTTTVISAALWMVALSFPWFLKKTIPTVSWTISFAVITYLLFSPHLNRADELLAFAPLLFLVARSTWKPKTSAAFSFLAGAILFNLSYLGINLTTLTIVLSVKLLIAILLVVQIKYSETPPHTIIS